MVEEGRREGRALGARALLVRLLTAKFGAVSDRERSRIDAASIAELERWAERILTASSIDDVFGP